MKYPKFIPPYWDEGQIGTPYHWYKKKKWKKILRKKWIRDNLKNDIE